MMTTRYHFTVLISAALLLTLAQPAIGQIVITEDDYRDLLQNRITWISYTADDTTGLQALADSTGGNQTWDFSAFTYGEADSATSEIVEPPVPGSDDPDFAEANIITRYQEADSAAYGFIKLDAEGLSLLGVVAIGEYDDDEETDTVIVKYTPPLLDVKLPLMEGTTWESSSSLAMDTLSILWNQDSAVEGWGTLVTPAGSTDALRVRENLTFGVISEEDTLILGTTTTIRFLTKENFEADIFLDEEGNATSASYTEFVGNGAVADEDENTIPDRISLEQNYPNPFNPETKIPFTLDRSEHVTLKIYDVLGRELATLIDGVQPAGRHLITWEAGNLPGGVYIYRLSSGGQTLTRNMTLIK